MIDMIKHREARGQERAEGIEAIERALAEIVSQNREPDLWERAFLQQAVEWLYRGGYLPDFKLLPAKIHRDTPAEIVAHEVTTRADRIHGAVEPKSNYFERF